MGNSPGSPAAGNSPGDQQREHIDPKLSENYDKADIGGDADWAEYLSNTQDYDRILVFLYDESSSVQEHETTRKNLIKRDEIEDVIIDSKPSQIQKNKINRQAKVQKMAIEQLKNKIGADDKSIGLLLKDQKFYIDYFQREYL
jgi:hypothetical protein